MCDFTFARLLQAAREERTNELGEMDLGVAKWTVADWLEHIRRTLVQIDPKGRYAAALTVLQRSFNGVLLSVQPARPSPPRDEAGFGRTLNRLTPLLKSSPEPPAEPVPVLLDGRVLFKQLLYTAEAVDALLDEAAVPEPVRETLPWADDQELLRQLWLLLGALATANGDAALAQLRQLEQTLRLHHDIEMRLVAHSGGGSAASTRAIMFLAPDAESPEPTEI